jgi:DNA-directed RNA polymerase specialized sigma24 family protein
MAGAVAETDLEYAWFFRSEYEGVARAVRVILGDAEGARDIAQESFVQLLVHWKKVSRYERPEAWVRRVAIRLAVRALRRERLRPMLERRAQPEPVRSLETDPEVTHAIARLSPSQRAAVVLFY